MSRLVIIATVAFLIGGIPAAQAEQILPTAAFTVREAPTFVGCTPLCMDAVWGDGGYDGFLTTELSFNLFTDKTLFEYDLSGHTTPVGAATVTFLLNHDASGGTVFARYYDGNGVAETSDWNAPVTLIAGFAPEVKEFTLDVTGAFNAAIAGNYGFLGLAFDYAPANSPWQTNMNGPVPFLTVTAVPEPATMSVLALGLAAAVRRRRRA